MRRRANHKYTKEYLEPLVKQAASFADLCKVLDIRHGGSQGHVKGKIREFGIDMSHFRSGVGWAKGIPNASARRSAQSILVDRSGSPRRTHGNMLYRSLLESGVADECAICKLKPE